MEKWNRAPNHLVYRHVRNSVIAILAARPDSGGRAVPACPDWKVRDLVAHLVDVCGLATRRLTGVEPARGRPRLADPKADERELPELIAAWETDGERLDELVAGDDGPGSNVLVMDAFTHELDLRHCVGLPPPSDHPGYPGMLDVVIGGFSAQVSTQGLPALRIEITGEQWSAGPEDPPTATLTAHRHDLYRTFTGRRTQEQIAALSWSGDPGPWLPAFTWGPFSPPPRPAESLHAGR